MRGGRRRGEGGGGGGGGVNPVTASGEHSGVVRGLYKTLSMNDSKHLNDREMGTGGGGGAGACMCVCARMHAAAGDSLAALTDMPRGE